MPVQTSAIQIHGTRYRVEEASSGFTAYGVPCVFILTALSTGDRYGLARSVRNEARLFPMNLTCDLLLTPFTGYFTDRGGVLEYHSPEGTSVARAESPPVAAPSSSEVVSEQPRLPEAKGDPHPHA